MNEDLYYLIGIALTAIYTLVIFYIGMHWGIKQALKILKNGSQH